MIPNRPVSTTFINPSTNVCLVAHMATNPKSQAMTFFASFPHIDSVTLKYKIRQHHHLGFQKQTEISTQPAISKIENPFSQHFAAKAHPQGLVSFGTWRTAAQRCEAAAGAFGAGGPDAAIGTAPRRTTSPASRGRRWLAETVEFQAMVVVEGFAFLGGHVLDMETVIEN